MNDDKKIIKRYFDQEAKDYTKTYQRECEEYPANQVRLDFVIEQLKQNNGKTILDVGCGICTPMIRLLKEGFKVKGIDFSEEMLKGGKKELEKSGFSSSLISQGDLENDSSFLNEKFDVVIALGVFPHILDEAKALSNIWKRLNKGGMALVQFRNGLFATFTMNKYSLDFFLNRVIDLSSLPSDIAQEVTSFYSKRLRADRPIKEAKGKITLFDILARWQNPLTIGEELFKPCRFSISKIHFYHYHALPPIFEDKYPSLFRELSLKLEKANHWKGYLMASSFIVEARKDR